MDPASTYENHVGIVKIANVREFRLYDAWTFVWEKCIYADCAGHHAKDKREQRSHCPDDGPHVILQESVALQMLEAIALELDSFTATYTATAGRLVQL